MQSQRQYQMALLISVLASLGASACSEDVAGSFVDRCGNTCGENAYCVDGTCVDVACREVSCQAGTMCKAGVCVETACYNVSCDAGEVCKGGKCLDPACVDVTCDEGLVCVKGSCLADPCENVFCDGGRVCDAGRCVEAECAGVSCPAGDVCQAGRCIDMLCVGVVCDGGLVCDSGACVTPDCAGIACNPGFVCQNGACRDLRCLDVECKADEYCSAGACVKNVCDPACGEGETCLDGVCRDTDCLDVVCGPGTTCQAGQCVDNACLDVTCEANQTCQGGKCVHDACLDVTCGPGKICLPDGTCAFPEDPGVTADVSSPVTTEDGKPVTTEDGKVTASVDVVLTQPPTSDVTLTCATDPATEAVIDCSGIVFTPDNWNIPQTVVITGVPDDVIDGDKGYTVSIVTSSEDADFDGLELADDLELVSKDTDTAEAVIVADVYRTSEDGQSATLSISLASKPTAPVTLTIVTDDPSEGTLSQDGTSSQTSLTVTIDPEDWNKPVQVVVTGVPDHVADGSQDYTVSVLMASEDPNFDGKSSSVELTNKDIDAPGITVTTPDGGLMVDEGKSSDIQLSLNTKPTGTVTIRVTVSDENQVSVSQKEITIAPDDWNDDNTLTVTGLDDSLIEGDQAFTLTFEIVGDKTDADEYKTGVTPVVVNGTTKDMTKSGFVLTSGGVTDVTEAGSTASFGLALTAQPTAEVVVTLSVADPTELALQDAGSDGTLTLKFDAENWDTPQTVMVVGVDDDIIDGDQVTSVIVTAASEDTNFDSATHPELTSQKSFKTKDDDTAALVIVPPVNTHLNESGDNTTSSYTFTLGARPAAPVSITLSSNDASELTGTFTDAGGNPVTSITIQPDDWNKPVTVNVQAKDDFIADGAQTASLAMKVTSEDPNFNYDQNSPDFTVADDEQATVIVAPVSLTFDPGTTSQTVTIGLSSAPTHDVTVSFVDPAGNPHTVVLTPTDWSGKTVDIAIGEYTAGVSELTVSMTTTSECTAYNNKKASLPVTIYALKTADFAISQKDGKNDCTSSLHTLTLYPGKYRLQVWGASGGDGVDYNQSGDSHAGLGGYAEGTLNVTAKTDVFVHIGGAGERTTAAMGTGAGCNAGGAGCAALSGSSKFYGYGGGGSTDIRLGTDSLYARVIVAGGGGGTDNSGDGEANNDGSGGYGGGISGGDATGSAKLKGATQTSGYQFGVGQNCGTGIDLGGGGGGWWGGLSEQSTNTNSGGSGGSGFIYTSETPAATLDSATIGGKFLLTNTQQLSNASMINGNASMVQPDGTNAIGRAGNGHARITLIVE